jgi:hypothetical protein
MAPKGLETPEACLIAILHGLEVGLTPLAALQRIAVINGRPTIWGDGALALVRASGLCAYVHETLRGKGDHKVATCTVKRRDEDEPLTRRFSVADARRAGLWGKEGPWQTFPDRMLQMRARAFALRDAFADVLGGLYLQEEMVEEALEGATGAAAEPTPTTPPGPTITSEVERHPFVLPPLPSAFRSDRSRPHSGGRTSPRAVLRRRRGPDPLLRDLMRPLQPRGHPAGQDRSAAGHDVTQAPLDILEEALAAAFDEATLAEVRQSFADHLAQLGREECLRAEAIIARHTQRVQAPTPEAPHDEA